MNKDSNETKLTEDENPPIFGSWNKLYIFVLNVNISEYHLTEW